MKTQINIIGENLTSRVQYTLQRAALAQIYSSPFKNAKECEVFYV